MRYDGFIESNDGLFVQGWAIDFSRPDEPVEVELELSNGWNAVVLADQFRPDLPERTGQRRHGFRCRLPTAVQEDRSFVVTGRIKDTNFVLHRSPLPVRPGPLLEVLAGDIVNNCNLRCPFCIVDYEKVKGLSLTPRSTFERSLALLPLVRDGNFWLSCMHEPTLHPELAEYVEAIPVSFRRKVSFTTNFCKRLSDDLLRRLAYSGIHSIRVSLDSMQPALFAQYRKGGRLEVFLENFRRFAAFLRESKQPPLLHIISMAFKENLSELPELVRRCREEFGAGLHEVRFMYYSPHLADWGVDHIMSMDQWRELKETLLRQFPDHRLDLCDPVDDIHARFNERRGVDLYEHPPAVFGGTMTATNYEAVDP
ncbi:MAG TPA: radical SAM protein, partial [Candidatus Synoicihabitans sp.]|nr:radical SAM protein [Candidatus Synoicihabitans sp.]